MRNLEDSDVSNLVSDSRRNFSRVAETAAERFIVHCERPRSVSKVRQRGGGGRKGRVFLIRGIAARAFLFLPSRGD